MQPYKIPDHEDVNLTQGRQHGVDRVDNSYFMEPSGRQDVARWKHNAQGDEVDRGLIREEVVGLYTSKRS